MFRVLVVAALSGAALASWLRQLRRKLRLSVRIAKAL
jgi:type II secretory pathway component PulM